MKTNITNLQILEELNKKVYGHQTAKRILINAVNRSRIRWHQEFNLGMTDKLVPLKNVLLLGGSGSGKTFLVECLQEVCDFPLVRFDATQILPSGAGSGGLTIKNMIKEIESNCAYWSNHSEGYFSASEIMKQTIVLIDEVDKLALSFESSGNWNKHVQSNLLQLINGKTEIKGVTFIFAGAFTEMLSAERKNTNKLFGFASQQQTNITEVNYEELIVKAGLIPELVGRIDSIVRLDELTIQDYCNILVRHIIPVALDILQYYDVYDLQLTEDVLLSIAKTAIKSEQGVRMLTKEIHKLIDKHEFDALPPYFDFFNSNLEEEIEKC